MTVHRAPSPEVNTMTEIESPYSTGDVARLLRVDSKTVLRWCEQGKLPSFRTPGGHRRIPRAVVDRIVRGEAK